MYVPTCKKLLLAILTLLCLSADLFPVQAQSTIPTQGPRVLNTLPGRCKYNERATLLGGSDPTGLTDYKCGFSNDWYVVATGGGTSGLADPNANGIIKRTGPGATGVAVPGASGDYAAGNDSRFADAATHAANSSNPHGVTKSQVGLGNVPNVDATNAANINSGTLDIARLPPGLGGGGSAVPQLARVDATHLTLGANCGSSPGCSIAWGTQAGGTGYLYNASLAITISGTAGTIRSCADSAGTLYVTATSGLTITGSGFTTGLTCPDRSQFLGSWTVAGGSLNATGTISTPGLSRENITAGTGLSSVCSSVGCVFNAVDAASAAGGYTATITAQTAQITILQTAHTRGISPLVQCWDNTSPDAVATTCRFLTRNSAGDIKLGPWDVAFTGTVTIY